MKIRLKSKIPSSGGVDKAIKRYSYRLAAPVISLDGNPIFDMYSVQLGNWTGTIQGNKDVK